MGRFSPKMVKKTQKVTFWMKNRPNVGIYETVYLKTSFGQFSTKNVKFCSANKSVSKFGPKNGNFFITNLQNCLSMIKMVIFDSNWDLLTILIPNQIQNWHFLVQKWAFWPILDHSVGL